MNNEYSIWNWGCNSWLARSIIFIPLTSGERSYSHINHWIFYYQKREKGCQGTKTKTKQRYLFCPYYTPHTFLLLFSCVSVNGIITHPFTQAVNLGVILYTSLFLTSLIHSPRCPVNSILYLSTPALPPQNDSSSLPTGLPSIHPCSSPAPLSPRSQSDFSKNADMHKLLSGLHP